jgi:hypothetical protein
MIGVIPNPKKSVTIAIPFNKVNFAVSNLKSVIPFLHFREHDEMFNSYTFAKNEFLSLGVLIDINLIDMGDNKTQINVEIRRKMGAFDESYEVQNASKHIQDVFNGISHIIKNGVPKPKQQVTTSQKSNSSFGVLGVLLFFTFVFMGLMYIKKYNERKIEEVNKYMNTAK